MLVNHADSLLNGRATAPAEAWRLVPERPFEALACGIPLVSAPWDDSEKLFRPGADFLVARNGSEMQRHLRAVLHDRGMALCLAAHGRRTILERHTCAHRVDELLAIYAELEPDWQEDEITV